MPLRFDCFLQKHQPEDVWNQRFTVLLKSAIFVWHILKKTCIHDCHSVVFFGAISAPTLYRHTIKTQSSYQNIFYSALKFHWSDLNDDTWKWCELQRKTKMLGEPIAGAAGLTLWHRPNQGDPARVTCWEEFQYLNALSTGKLKTKGTGTKYQTFNTNAWKPSAQK